MQQSKDYQLPKPLFQSHVRSTTNIILTFILIKIPHTKLLLRLTMGLESCCLQTSLSICWKAQHDSQCFFFFYIPSNLSERNKNNNLMNVRMNWGEGWYFCNFIFWKVFRNPGYLLRIYIYIYIYYFRGETALTDWLNMSISTELVSHTRKSLMSCGLA